MVHKFDFLVIGSGIAGMSLALKVADKGKVAIICKTELEEANTYFAQGGIASVTNLAVDNFDKHIEDTMIAGDWLNDRSAVEMVVRNAPSQIQELIRWGVQFDKKENGEFDLHLFPRDVGGGQGQLELPDVIFGVAEVEGGIQRQEIGFRRFPRDDDPRPPFCGYLAGGIPVGEDEAGCDGFAAGPRPHDGGALCRLRRIFSFFTAPPP